MRHTIRSIKRVFSIISSKKNTALQVMLKEIYNKPEYKAKVYDPENQKRLKVIFKTRLGRWSKHDKGKTKIKNLSKTLEEKVAYWEGKIIDCNKTKADIAKKANRLERLILTLIVFFTCTLLGRKSSFKQKQQENLDAIEEALPNMKSLKLYLKNLSIALQSALPASFWMPYEDEEYNSKLSETSDEEQINTLDDMIREIENFIAIRATRESRKSLVEELEELFIHISPNNEKESEKTTEQLEALQAIALEENATEIDEHKAEAEENHNEKVETTEEIEAERTTATEESLIETEEHKAGIEEAHETTEEMPKVEMLETLEEIENIQEKINEEAHRVVEPIIDENGGLQVSVTPSNPDITNKETAPPILDPQTETQRSVLFSGIDPEEKPINAFTAPANGVEKQSQKATSSTETKPQVTTNAKVETQPRKTEDSEKGHHHHLPGHVCDGTHHHHQAKEKGEKGHNKDLPADVPLIKDPKVETKEKSEKGHHHHHYHPPGHVCECCNQKKNIPDEPKNTFISKKRSVRR